MAWWFPQFPHQLGFPDRAIVREGSDLPHSNWHVWARGNESCCFIQTYDITIQYIYICIYILYSIC